MTTTPQQQLPSHAHPPADKSQSSPTVTRQSPTGQLPRIPPTSTDPTKTDLHETAVPGHSQSAGLSAHFSSDSLNPGDSNEYAPLGEIKALTQERERMQDIMVNPLLKYTVRARRHDMSFDEKHKVAILTTSASGQCRHDHVAPRSNRIYRNPIPLCPNPH